MLYPCPYLDATVELSDERARHIGDRHPDLFPEHLARVEDVLAGPDEVRVSPRSSLTRLFSRWFADLRGGKHVVVVVAHERGRTGGHRVVTAYMTRRLSSKGDVEWKRD